MNAHKISDDALARREHEDLRSLVAPVLWALRRADLNKLHRALAKDLVEASFNALAAGVAVYLCAELFAVWAAGVECVADRGFVERAQFGRGLDRGVV